MAMEIDLEKFEEVKDKAEAFYKTIGKIYCPHLKENVNFNTKGLNHIKFKTWNRARVCHDQYMRLKLIYLAPEIIKKMEKNYYIMENRMKTENKKTPLCGVLL